MELSYKSWKTPPKLIHVLVGFSMAKHTFHGGQLYSCKPPSYYVDVCIYIYSISKIELE